LRIPTIRATESEGVNTLRVPGPPPRNLGGYPWTCDTVGNGAHIGAAHFTELRNAIQDLWNPTGMGTIPIWSFGGATAAGGTRPISARDTKDLRRKIQQYQDHTRTSDDPNAWGVDSCATTNSMVGSQTLFDYVAQQAGAARPLLDNFRYCASIT